jgi:hypothetical protein
MDLKSGQSGLIGKIPTCKMKVALHKLSISGLYYVLQKHMLKSYLLVPVNVTIFRN